MLAIIVVFLPKVKRLLHDGANRRTKELCQVSLFVITYDVRITNRDGYESLYDQLKDWGAAHLQDSVWFVGLNGTAAQVRDALSAHMHPDDTVCVIEICSNSGWATRRARKSGTDWLRSHMG